MVSFTFDAPEIHAILTKRIYLVFAEKTSLSNFRAKPLTNFCPIFYIWKKIIQWNFWFSRENFANSTIKQKCMPNKKVFNFFLEISSGMRLASGFSKKYRLLGFLRNYLHQTFLNKNYGISTILPQFGWRKISIPKFSGRLVTDSTIKLENDCITSFETQNQISLHHVWLGHNLYWLLTKNREAPKSRLTGLNY